MKYTPMIEQYLKIKKDYQDMFLFYRLGDFYELFFEDATRASKILEITLTARDGGVEKVPMCGVPFHAAANYIDVLVNNGYKVAICEQVSEPGQGKIVERKVVQVITPGTYMNYKNYDENNFLASAYKKDGNIYFAFCDIMTGDSRCTILKTMEDLQDEILRNNIKEIITIKDQELNVSAYITEVEVDENIEKLISAFMPGPITLILKKNDILDDYITNGKNTIAVRMATSNVLEELIKKVGSPLFMTSANRSGEPECKKIDEIEKISPLIDGILCGKCNFGMPSTIVDCSSEKIEIIRRGPILEEQIKEVLND